MTRISPTSRAAPGFTLLELLVVLAILAMGSALLLPGIGNLNSRTFSSQVREAAAVLNYARRTAVVTGQASTARFYPAPSENADSAMPAEMTAREERWQAQGVSLSFQDSTQQRTPVEDSVAITFFPEGGSTGGALVLTLDEREARITIDPFSGNVQTEFSDE